MIDRSRYTDDEWEEILARCKIMTENGHSWKRGDIIWLNNDLVLLHHPPFEKNPTLANFMRLSDGEIFTTTWKGMIWLPRLDQIIDHELNPYQYYIEYINYHDTSSKHAPRLLIMIRGIQQCRHYCDIRMLHTDPRCNGIHPNHSLEPNMRVKKEGNTEIVSIDSISLTDYHGPHYCMEHYKEMEND